MKNKICGECKHYNNCGVISPDIIADYCEDFEQKPKTNRDVINAMTDEELAKWHCDFPYVSQKKDGYCRIFWQNPKRCRPEMTCKQCMIDWLKAPAGKHQEVQK